MPVLALFGALGTLGVVGTPAQADGVTWTTRTSAANNDWKSVTWGGPAGQKTFVAIADTGTGNQVMTSPDGITWTTRTSAADKWWSAVTWGGPAGHETFVAVAYNGTGDRVMTSPDGITWTSQTSAADNDWLSVTWGGPAGAELFVAVADTGTGNRVMTSPDGITWTSRASAADNGWYSVTWGGPAGAELFVAVATSGTGNRVMTSPDGIIWSTQTSAADNRWWSVTWGGPTGQETFVAVADTGTGNRVMTSPDGINWTTRTSAADNRWSSVTWGGPTGQETFVAVAFSGTGNRVMTSPDGINWTTRTSAADNGWYSVTWGGPTGQETFVAVATSGTGNRVMTSSVNPTPTVSGVSPSSGVPAGGNTLTITGTGFISGATVSVGNQPCTSVTVVSTSSLTCVAPAGTEGAVVDVAVTNIGTAAGIGVGLYTYRTPFVVLPLIPTTTTVPPPTTTVSPATTTTVPPSTVAPSTTVPAPVPADADTGELPQLEPGAAAVTKDGVAIPVELLVEDSTDLVLRGQDFELRLSGECADGCEVTSDDNGRDTIELESDGAARVSGEGFLPGTPVYVWLFSEPRFLGEFTVADDGTFLGRVQLTGVELGAHTLQVNGTSFDGLMRSSNLGIVVAAAATPTPGDTELPSTGQSTLAGLWALLLLATGATALTLGGRRRSVLD